MKLGENFFRKGQPLWAKPLITYDPSRMDVLFAETASADIGLDSHPPSSARTAPISVETELYLMLNS